MNELIQPDNLVTMNRAFTLTDLPVVPEALPDLISEIGISVVH